MKYNTMKIALVFILPFLFASCISTKKAREKLVYFQENKDTLSLAPTVFAPTLIQKNDQLLISVASQSTNQDQVAIFNLQNSGSGTVSEGKGSQAAATTGYLVDFDGYIFLPYIGKVKAEGITKEELTNQLQEKLKVYIKDPIVSIRYLSYKIDVLGEVGAPGPHVFNSERVNILDVIGASGDLNDRADRKEILVVRTNPSGTHSYKKLDITKADIYLDPYFQMQQNDLVYVAPSKNGLRQMSQNPNALRSLTIATTFISLALSIFTTVQIINK